MFASHPASEERSAKLRALAGALPEKSRAEPDRLAVALKKLRGDLLADELRLRQYGQTEIMLTRRIQETGGDGWLHFALAEVYRLRDQEGDLTRALDQYARAKNDAEAPAEAHRGEGLVRRRMGDHASASEAFRRYLDAAPNAPDRAVIQPYVL
jgi:tetratricopeptide (TPR) repeat protein